MGVESGFHQDFLDILHALSASGVELLVIGAHAMAVHGVPRATGDLDILVRPHRDNARRILEAVRAFGAPVGEHGVAEEELERPDVVYQIGLPPRRIDLMTSISGVSFEDAWSGRVTIEIDGMRAGFIGRKELIETKKVSARDKDIVDLRLLEG